MANPVCEVMSPRVCRLILKELGVRPGPVDDLFLVKTVSCIAVKGIFKALQVLKRLVATDFEFVVNQAAACQLFFRGTSAAARAKLEQALEYTFKFDELRVKFFKIDRIVRLSYSEDIYCNAKPMTIFPAYVGGFTLEEQSEIGYPLCYYDIIWDMESIQNPKMSETTMSILGVVEGHNQDIVRVNIKPMITPEDILLAYHILPKTVKGHKMAVDQHGRIYMKLEDPTDALYLMSRHFFTGGPLVHRVYPCGSLVKFHRIETVTKVALMKDSGRICPLYSTINDEDFFEHHPM